MGDRGQVKIKDTGVYLYTHWGASELREAVAAALAKAPGRWDDEEYLARIIFDAMKGDNTGETGFGIGTSEHGDVWRVVEVDCGARMVRIRDLGEEPLEVSFANLANTAPRTP